MLLIFVPIAELVIPTGTATNEVNAKIKTQPVEAKIRRIQHYLNTNMSFDAIHSLNYVLFLVKDFLFHLFFQFKLKICHIYR